MWPQFRSPLIWDVFAVSTYATVSLLFWYVGLIPDLATLRDRRQDRSGSRSIYGMLAMGWRGSARHWHRYETAYLLLAGLSTPLVLSVHTVVSLRLRRRRMIPGWHATIFPPYFVAGADLRRLRDGADARHPAARSSTASRTSSPMRHLDNMAQGDARHRPDRRLRLRDGAVHRLVQRQPVRECSWCRTGCSGPTRWIYWLLILCNVLAIRSCSGSSASADSVPAVLDHLDGRQRRHVARALRDHRRPACTATSCRRRGACTTPTRLGLRRPSSARSACSWP